MSPIGCSGHQTKWARKTLKTLYMNPPIPKNTRRPQSTSNGLRIFCTIYSNGSLPPYVKIHVSKLYAPCRYPRKIVHGTATSAARPAARPTAHITERRCARSASLSFPQWANAGMNEFLISQNPAYDTARLVMLCGPIPDEPNTNAVNVCATIGPRANASPASATIREVPR